MGFYGIWIMSIVTITWIIGLGLFVYEFGDDRGWWDKDMWDKDE